MNINPGSKTLKTEYQIRRDNLIPIAERYANEKCGKSCRPGENHENWSAAWSLTFSNKMDELAKEGGLI